MRAATYSLTGPATESCASSTSRGPNPGRRSTGPRFVVGVNPSDVKAAPVRAPAPCRLRRSFRTATAPA